MAKRVQKVYDVFWAPTGQKIATVTAPTAKMAKRKAPAPYSRYKGEIYVEDRGPATNPRRVVSKHATKAQAQSAANELRKLLRRRGVKGTTVRVQKNPSIRKTKKHAIKLLRKHFPKLSKRAERADRAVLSGMFREMKRQRKRGIR